MACVTLPCLYLLTKADDPFVRVALVTFAAIPVVMFCFSYLFFMFKDPDRLHSEDYQLRNRSLDLIESKGTPISYRPEDVISIANPYPNAPRIGDSREGGGNV